ncbi:unnamed protein product [marine sediment metagenome]|uniref:Uncharacterized protein n=1 Tax=marine sediment metagenome TaxID=412755 RepID=X1DZ17_9ZZZZ
MDTESQEFWMKQSQHNGNWVNIVDGIPVKMEIDDWTIHRPDSSYGKNAAIKTVSGKYFPVSAKYLTKLFNEFDMIDKHVEFSFTRYNSNPNPRDTHGKIENVVFL